MDGPASLPLAEPSSSTSDLLADKNTGHEHHRPSPVPSQKVAGGVGDAEQEQGRGGAVGVATGARGGEGGGAGKKKSSFERIVEKLAPVYPHYARYVRVHVREVYNILLNFV